jgi:hypothetical protein
MMPRRASETDVLCAGYVIAKPVDVGREKGKEPVVTVRLLLVLEWFH